MNKEQQNKGAEIQPIQLLLFDKWSHLTGLPEYGVNEDIGLIECLKPEITLILDDIPNVYFTSDWHLGHKNVIEYAERTCFNNVVDMDIRLISNVNKVCDEDSILFQCGDMLFGYYKNWVTIRTRVRPRTVYSVIGNHDYRNLDIPKRFITHFTAVKLGESLRHFDSNGMLRSDYIRWRFNKKYTVNIIDNGEVLLKIAVTHEPIDKDVLTQEGYDLNLHGHLHSFPDIDRYKGTDKEYALSLIEDGRYYDVGVDRNDYKPVCLKDILTGNIKGIVPNKIDTEAWKKLLK